MLCTRRYVTWVIVHNAHVTIRLIVARQNQHTATLNYCRRYEKLNFYCMQSCQMTCYNLHDIQLYRSYRIAG